MTPEQAEAHCTPVAVLRPRPVRRLVELLSPCPSASGRQSLRRRYTREP